MWGHPAPRRKPESIIEKHRKADLRITEPKNLEEQALSLVGRDIYEKLVKGYTEKQWGRECTELPSLHHQEASRSASSMTIITLMIRYQGIPDGRVHADRGEAAGQECQ